MMRRRAIASDESPSPPASPKPASAKGVFTESAISALWAWVSRFELLGSQTAKGDNRLVKDENVVSFNCGRAVLVVTGCRSLRRSLQVG
jgi:hypothetical protein